MSAGADKVPAAAAREIAEEMLEVLSPRCERIEIAGSLRRQQSFVSDVEILFIPKFIKATDPGDLFGGKVRVNDAELAIAALVDAGLLEKRPKADGSLTWGPDNKLAVHVHSGIPVDLFTASPANWWNYLVCRTGPAKSNVAIAAAAKARGWKWNPYGNGFTRDRAEGEVQVHCVQNERDVFAFVGLPYLEPNQR